jgi:hypothetical protein
MDIKIGYEKINGEAEETILRIDDDGFISLVGPSTNKCMMVLYLLSDCKKRSAVFLGVDEND